MDFANFAAKAAATPITDGTILHVKGQASIFKSCESWDKLKEVNFGDTVTAAGEPKDCQGYKMVPIRPMGAIDLNEVALSKDDLPVPVSDFSALMPQEMKQPVMQDGLCWHYKKGFCSKGASCRWSHLILPSQRAPEAPPSALKWIGMRAVANVVNGPGVSNPQAMMANMANALLTGMKEMQNLQGVLPGQQASPVPPQEATPTAAAPTVARPIMLSVPRTDAQTVPPPGSEEEMRSRSTKITEGIILDVVRAVQIVVSCGSCVAIGILKVGDTIEAAGPPVTGEGVTMVPVKPKGFVDATAVKRQNEDSDEEGKRKHGGNSEDPQAKKARETKEEWFRADKETLHPTKLTAGTMVRIHGLKAKPELNGRIVECESFDTTSGRWQVVTSDDARFKLKEANLFATKSWQTSFKL